MRIIFSLVFLSCTTYAMKTDLHYQKYKERFPQARQSYKKYSNDHELFIEHLDKEVVKFKKKYPDIFKNEVNIFTIGCHDGDTSKSTVEIIEKYDAQAITLYGIDPYPEHISQTHTKLWKLKNDKNINLKKVMLSTEDLNTYKPKNHHNNCAHIILVEQICHHVYNLEQLIQNIQQIAAPNSIVIFGHTDDSDSALNSLFNKIIGGHKYINTDVCSKIKNILKKNNYTFTKQTKTQQFKLPKISDKTWTLLKSIKNNYNNKYRNWSQDDLDAKHILEFCATQPLEKLAASNGWFFPTKLTIFLTALKFKLGTTIDLTYKIHTVHINKK